MTILKVEPFPLDDSMVMVTTDEFGERAQPVFPESYTPEQIKAGIRAWALTQRQVDRQNVMAVPQSVRVLRAELKALEGRVI